MMSAASSSPHVPTAQQVAREEEFVVPGEALRVLGVCDQARWGVGVGAVVV